MSRFLFTLGLAGVLGVLGWLGLGRLDRPQVGDDHVERPPAPPPQVSIADALSMPIFRPSVVPVIAPTSQTPTTAQSSLKLLGISLTPRRRAAFVSLGGPAFWLSVGQSRDGVTLNDLRQSTATFDVNGAPVTLVLFRQPPPPLTTAPSPIGADPAPPVRSREPASAPTPGPASLGAKRADPPQVRPGDH